MTLKERIYAAVAVIVGFAALLVLRDSRSRALLDGFLRKKKVTDLAAKIEREMDALNLNVKYTEEALHQEANRYRTHQLDESPEAIREYYRQLFK